MKVAIERVYDFVKRPKRPGEVAILVDRLWPRGVRKEALEIDAWLKDVAPSTELRKWFHHEERSWTEFQQRYLAELQANPEPLKELRDFAHEALEVTLLFAARETEQNHAMVL